MGGTRTRQVLVMLGGMIAWAVQFTVIYGVTSTLCGRSWVDSATLGIGIVQAFIMATALVALVPTALMLLMLLRVYRHVGEDGTHAAKWFMMQAGILINGLSLVVVLWQGGPAFILPACA
jgi:multisubunit Na+/H+ antiporter MnhC subunit